MASLIRELMALQEQDGWLSGTALAGLAARLNVPLHRLESVSTFYTHLRRRPPKRHRIDVCRDLSCALAGAQRETEQLQLLFGARDDVEINEVSCLGRCDIAPAAVAGRRIFSTASSKAVSFALDPVPAPMAAPSETPGRWGAAEVYGRTADRYETLRGALGRDPGLLARELTAAGLRGMGGAAFPTGHKWSLVAAEPARPKYIVCNADESEPGSFKDREILRDLSHLVIEGMLLAAYAVGAERGFIFVRHEYAPERERVEATLREARSVGALGPDIFGSGLSFDIEVFVSPGGYILGEETALLECMEDRRGEPRNKPPYPGSVGLFGKPTLINNVETLAHATAIVRHGADWWRELGCRGIPGHKFISVSGDVARPGVHLVPSGTTFSELLALCEGMKEARPLVAFGPGGASSRLFGVRELDVSIDFESVAAAGSMLGSGGVVFIGEGHDLLNVGLSLTRFFRNESCGKCVPCRIGTDKAVKLLEQADGLSAALHERLEKLNETLGRTSLCGLGQVALTPLLSIAERFPERVRRG